MNQHVPPGWYPNEHGHRQWWDGYRWGPLAPPPPAMAQPFQPPPMAPPAQPKKSNVGEILSGIGCLAVVVLILVVFVACSIGGNVTSDSSDSADSDGQSYVDETDYSTFDWEALDAELEQDYLDAVRGIYVIPLSSSELDEAVIEAGYSVCDPYYSGWTPEELAILAEGIFSEFETLKPGAGKVVVDAAIEYLC